MIVKEIPYIEPIAVARQLYEVNFAALIGCPQICENSQYSFIGADASLKLQSINHKSFLNNKEDPRSINKILQTTINNSIKNHPDLPPFQGGWIGAWHYSYASNIHNMITFENQPINGTWLFFETVVSFDNLKQKTFLISTSQNKINWLHKKIYQEKQASFTKWQLKPETNHATQINKINQAKQAIFNGDIFEVNITQRFSSPHDQPAWDTFEQLWQQNNANFSAFFQTDEYAILSASPERFIKVHNNVASSRPIKGTAKAGPENAHILRFNKKQIAENTMIVDLVRSDLSKVCKPHSVKVTEFCNIESYQNIQNLVSEIQGTLMDNKNSLDAFDALFPAGSITGAPKIQAMQCIKTIENYPRDIYCGSIGYLSYDGNIDSSVLIRTMWLIDNTLYAYAGGAILLDSNAESEQQETMLKAQKLIRNINE